MRTTETLLWTLIGLSLALGMNLWRPAPLSNDSFQYLSIAANLEEGRGLTTPLVHFDTERSSGRLPAPMTTFAAGYPAAVAAMSFLTGDVDRAARLTSALCYVASIPLLIGLANLLGFTRLATRVALVFLVVNSFHLRFSTAVAAEPIFIMASMAALLLLGRALVPELRYGYLIAGQVLVAVAYWMRYAGVFLFVAVILYAALRCVLQRNRRGAIILSSCVISGMLVAAVMLRNALLVGSWKGGNDKDVNFPLIPILGEYIKAQYHLLVGSGKVGVWTACTAVVFAIAAAVVLLPLTRRAKQWIAETNFIESPAALLIAYVLVYTAGMIYAGKTSMITFNERMFHPLLPLYALGAGAVFAEIWRLLISRDKFQRAAPLFFALLLVPYVASNGLDAMSPPPPSLADSVRDALQHPETNGGSMLTWIERHIPPEEAIAAMSGQATGYVLHRPTLSLVDERVSRIKWDRRALEVEMRRFKARFLILYPALQPPDPVASESPFIAGALCCRVTPGFRIVAESPNVRILQLEAAQ